MRVEKRVLIEGVAQRHVGLVVLGSTKGILSMGFDMLLQVLGSFEILLAKLALVGF